MNLTAISNSELIGRIEKLAQSERKLTHVILCHINEIESRRLYAELGYESMFRYLTAHLKYSEDAAYRRLSAARLLRKSPEIAERLEDGRLTLTQLTQVQSALRQEMKRHTDNPSIIPVAIPQILEKIENKNSFETKKTLAQELNLPTQTHDIVTPQRDESVRLEITLTPEQMKTLETARDLMSHTLPDGNWADLLTLLATKQIQKILGKDNLKGLNSEAKSSFTGITTGAPEANPKHHTKQENTDNKRKEHPNHLTMLSSDISTQSFLVAQKRGHIKVTTKRALLLKAEYCCEFVDTNSGRKCGSKYQLQFDHIQPIVLGGSDDVKNFRVLCRTHNLFEASRMGIMNQITL